LGNLDDSAGPSAAPNHAVTIKRLTDPILMNAILNDADTVDTAEPVTPQWAAVLLDTARQAKTAALQDASRASPACTEAFDRLQRHAGRLGALDLDRALEDRNVALAFWINLYNAMVIHGALRHNVRRTVTEVRGFFKRTVYRVGCQRFSLDAIEHGILRQNRGHPLRLGISQFPVGDARRRWVLRPMDRRIHFALNCGARSCPPIRHYEPSRIDEQLALAAAGFVSQSVTVSNDTGGVLMSRLFLWYARDFGWSKRAQLASAVSYLEPDQRAAIIPAARNGIRYSRYDWSFA